MKKCMIISVLLFISAMGGFANGQHRGFMIGTGLYGGYGYGTGLMLKTSGLPLYWGINVSLDGIHNEQYFGISLSGDYHFIDTPFSGSEKTGWFVGGGVIFSHNHFDGKSALAGRIPIGIYFAPIKRFDFVLEIAPALGVFMKNDIEFDYGMSGTFGIRYWL